MVNFGNKILVIFTMVVLIGCNSGKNMKTESHDNISIMRLHDIWSLVEISGNTLVSKNTSSPNLEIFVEKKEILGNGGCNNYSGSIKEVNKSEISFSPIRSTKMACSQLNLETKFFTALQNTRTYNLDNLKLTFFNGKGERLLVFKKVD